MGCIVSFHPNCWKDFKTERNTTNDKVNVTRPLFAGLIHRWLTWITQLQHTPPSFCFGRNNKNMSFSWGVGVSMDRDVFKFSASKFELL